MHLSGMDRHLCSARRIELLLARKGVGYKIHASLATNIISHGIPSKVESILPKSRPITFALQQIIRLKSHDYLETNSFR